MDLSDKNALRRLLAKGRLKVGKQVSADRANSLIRQGLAEPAYLGEKLPQVITPSVRAKAQLAAAEIRKLDSDITNAAG